MEAEIVQNGCKQTELGRIPEEWEVVKIGDHFDFKNGLNKEKKFFGHGTPIVNYMDVYTHNGLNSNDIKGKVSVSNDEIRAHNIRKGDVLFTRTSETSNEIGLPAVIMENVENAVFSGFLLRARPKTDYFNLQFKKYCFLSEIVRKQIISTSSETTRALTNGELLSQVLVPVPQNPKEQLAIAIVLSDIDALMESLDKLIEKKKKIKKGAMQELLTGKRRLIGNQELRKNWKSTDIGIIPEDWEVKTLGEIGTPIIGLTYSPRNVKDYGLLVLRASNIGDSGLKYDNNVYVNIKVPKKLYTKAGDILVCVRSGSRHLIGKSAYIDENAEGYTFGAFMSIYRTNYSRFVFHLFNSDILKKQIQRNLGATINQITNNDFKRFIIPFPPTEEERIAISQVLSDMDSEIQELEYKRYKYRQLKTGMMQQLLMGRIRLKWKS